MKKEKTKAELITEFREKTKKAHPMIKRHLYPSLKYKNKTYLRRLIRKVKVTRGGELDFR